MCRAHDINPQKPSRCMYQEAYGPKSRLKLKTSMDLDMHPRMVAAAQKCLLIWVELNIDTQDSEACAGLGWAGLGFSSVVPK